MKGELTLENNIKKNIEELAEKVVIHVPDEGIFDDVSLDCGNIDPSYEGYVEFAVGSWVAPAGKSFVHDWRKKRYLEVKVYSDNRESDSSQWLYSGTKEDIIKYLRESSSIKAIAKSIESGIEHLRLDFM